MAKVGYSDHGICWVIHLQKGDLVQGAGRAMRCTSGNPNNKIAYIMACNDIDVGGLFDAHSSITCMDKEAIEGCSQDYLQKRGETKGILRISSPALPAAMAVVSPISSKRKDPSPSMDEPVDLNVVSESMMQTSSSFFAPSSATLNPVKRLKHTVMGP